MVHMLIFLYVNITFVIPKIINILQAEMSVSSHTKHVTFGTCKPVKSVLVP